MLTLWFYLTLFYTFCLTVSGWCKIKTYTQQFLYCLKWVSNYQMSYSVIFCFFVPRLSHIPTFPGPVIDTQLMSTRWTFPIQFCKPQILSLALQQPLPPNSDHQSISHAPNFSPVPSYPYQFAEVQIGPIISTHSLRDHQSCTGHTMSCTRNTKFVSICWGNWGLLVCAGHC